MATKRALILAGGGMKVAFQAGVLQVWLDEAGLQFDHVDGASGGVFNLAMMCQGMSGTEIADNWRNLNPRAGVSFNWGEYLKLLHAESMFSLDAYRSTVFPGWGLDWEKIRATPLEATFNTYNFTRQELQVIDGNEITEDLLCSCVSLPMWFPPVRIDGEVYIDAVYATDANLEEALLRGADELWIIWTVSEKGEWQDGFVANYFQIIEASANSKLRSALQRIERNNQALASGGPAEFGRPIQVRMLRAEVELHYLINFSQDRIGEAVNAGVLEARQWCERESIPFSRGRDYDTTIHQAETRLSFTEEMKGFATIGETDPETGYRQGRAAKSSLMFHLTIQVDGVNRFVTDPRHEATASGYLKCEMLGGKLLIEKGIFNLFVSETDPSQKRMLYRLFFQGTLEGRQEPMTLSGFKKIRDDPNYDLWADTTTLYTRILRGHVTPDKEGEAEVIAAGIIHIHMTDFLRQLTTFRTEGPSIADRAAAMGRFGKLFMGKLWDVYARHVITQSPF